MLSIVASTVADASSQPDAPGARLRSDLGQPRPRCPSPVHGPARCRQEEPRTDSDWKTSAGGRRCRSSSVKSMQGTKRLKSHENKHSQESWAGRALTPGDGGGASTAPAPRLADAGTGAAPWPGRTPHANSPGSRRPQPRGRAAGRPVPVAPLRSLCLTREDKHCKTEKTRGACTVCSLLKRGLTTITVHVHG